MVIDHLSKFASDMNIESSSDVRPLMDHLSKLAGELNIAIIIVTHTGKNNDWGKGKAKTQAFGSAFLKHEARSIIKMEKTKSGAKLTLEHSNYEDVEEYPPIHLERVGRAFRETTKEAAQVASQEESAKDAEKVVTAFLEWLSANPDANVTLGGMEKNRGRENQSAVAHIREECSDPEKKASAIAEAIRAAVKAGIVATKTTKNPNGETRDLLYIPD